MNLRPWITLAGVVAVAAIVVGLMQLGGGGETVSGHSFTVTPGVPQFHVEIDKTQDGDTFCNPVDATSVEFLGDSYRVAVCVTDFPAQTDAAYGADYGIGLFTFNLLYDKTLNSCTDVTNAGTALDDNPDANAGSTTWPAVGTGDTLGGGFDCSGFGSGYPWCDRDIEGDDENVGRAYLGCGSLNGPYDLGDDEASGVLGTVQFTVIGTGQDNLTLENVTITDPTIAEIGSCNPGISIPIPCFGAIDEKGTPTPTPVPPTLTTTASGPVTVGDNIHDVAHLSGGSGTLGGSISFEVFAPGDTSCSSPIAVSPDATVSGAGDYTSGDYTTSAVGDYRWIAHYSGDANNNAVDTGCNDANESSTVGKATPTLTTTASGPVTVGEKIHDVAHLGGGYGTLGGSITFDVFAPADTSCSTPIAVSPAATVSGVGDYTSGDYTTSAVGTYRWIAHYSGDANNDAVDTGCNDANESSTPGKATPTLTTTASGPVTVGDNIHDVAHLGGGYGTLGGSITFDVFAPGDTSCSTPTAVSPAATVSGAGNYNSGDYTTSAAGDYRWIAHYSGDANNNAVDTGCNDANESSTVNEPTPTPTPSNTPTPTNTPTPRPYTCFFEDTFGRGTTLGITDSTWVFTGPSLNVSGSGVRHMKSFVAAAGRSGSVRVSGIGRCPSGPGRFVALDMSHFPLLRIFRLIDLSAAD